MRTLPIKEILKKNKAQTILKGNALNFKTLFWTII